ncbi:MAG: hypothetical protein ACJ8KX_13090 [Chthoniobacterales bacterium]
MKKLLQTLAIAAVLACMASSTAQAQQLITNGGFESGFAGWTRSDQVGSESTWLLQSGTTSPVNGFTVPAPPGGTRAAMTDAMGPGSHVLYQDIVVPAAPGAAMLSFSLYINNHTTAFSTPNSLDFSTPALNQQFRVDVITTSADPFSVAVGDVLLAVYQTAVGNPLISGYTTISADLTALFASRAGQTLRLRFAEVDNVNAFNAGVDNVSLVNGPVASVPESGETVALLFSSVSLLGLLVLKQRRTAEFVRG